MDKPLLINYSGVEITRQEKIILQGVDMKVYAGEFVYLIGKVGTGKSSLMKSMYKEIPIEEGQASVLEYDLVKMRNRDIPYLRRKIGIVFQDFKLLIDRPVHENLMFVLKATTKQTKEEMEERIEEVLKMVGMLSKAYKMPHELSGGEQQRIVIARSMLNNPPIILADEPTGNLDPETGREIVQLLQNISQQGTTVIMTTHNHRLVHEYPGRLFKCEERKLVELDYWQV